MNDIIKIEQNNKDKPTELDVKYLWTGKVILDRKGKKALRKYLKWLEKELKKGEKKNE